MISVSEGKDTDPEEVQLQSTVSWSALGIEEISKRHKLRHFKASVL